MTGTARAEALEAFYAAWRCSQHVRSVEEFDASPTAFWITAGPDEFRRMIKNVLLPALASVILPLSVHSSPSVVLEVGMA